MTRDELRTAGEELRRAGETASGDVADRLVDQSEQLDQLATADRGPDHGRLARHERALSTIAEEEGGEVADHVERALAEIRSYRETVEGV